MSHHSYANIELDHMDEFTYEYGIDNLKDKIRGCNIFHQKEKRKLTELLNIYLEFKPKFHALRPKAYAGLSQEEKKMHDDLYSSLNRIDTIVAPFLGRKEHI